MRRFVVFLLALGLVAFAVSFITAACGPCGDVNGDGALNSGDCITMARCLIDGDCSNVVCWENFDVNGNGNPDLGDIIYLRNYIFYGGPAPVCP